MIVPLSGCTMSWMGGLGWKEGLSGVQMQKVLILILILILILLLYFYFSVDVGQMDKQTNLIVRWRSWRRAWTERWEVPSRSSSRWTPSTRGWRSSSGR